MYESRSYCPAAWKDLREWVGENQDRRNLLQKFTNKDTEFISLVASCLWKLATAANLPWGRCAVQPSVYSGIPPHEKVICRNLHLVLFFLVIFFYVII